MIIKKGTKVRWLGESMNSEPSIIQGKIYTVKESNDKECYLIEIGTNASFPNHLFEIIEIKPGTKVRWLGESDWLMLTNGKEYSVLSAEKEWFRIIDNSGEDYLYPPEMFEIVE